jgi:hypothetical protein
MRRDPIPNYLRQGLLHPKVLVPWAYLTIEIKDANVAEKFQPTISPKEILAKGDKALPHRRAFYLNKTADKQAERSGMATPGQFPST